MRRTVKIGVLILLGAAGHFAMVAAAPVSQALLSPRSLPENPCDLIDAAELSRATGLDVTSVERVPSIPKIVQAQREGRAPDPGTICSYTTTSAFGAIMIFVPTPPDRRTALYWERRSTYFRTFPSDARHVDGLGMDAWLAGGTSLRVLLRDNEYFGVTTQYYHPRSQDLLVDLAHTILRKHENLN